MGRMHANVYALLENAELVGCVDRRTEKAEAFAKDFGCPVFATIDEAVQATGANVVDVCLPTVDHAAATIKGAELGCHVICEKPMALDVATADTMIAACEKAGVQLMVGHCIRYWPEYDYLKRLVDSGELGALQVVNLTRYGAFPSWASENWQADESKAGGGALDMRIHDTDFILYLLGDPDTMHSDGQLDERGVGYSISTMRFGKTVAILEGGWSWPQNTPFRMTFRAMFERGAAIMEGGPLTIYRDGQSPEVVEFAKMATSGGGNISDLGGYFVELKDFIEHLEAGQPTTVVTPQTSRRSLEVALEEIAQIKAKHQ
jgi:predicted dehydrogenase